MKSYLSRTRYLLLFLVLLTLTFATDAGATQSFTSSANSHSPLGTNLIRISDYSPDMVFLDAFKASRPWITRDNSTWTWDTGEEEFLDLDEQGWVRSLPDPDSGLTFDAVATLLLYSLDGHYPSGRYVVLYEGEGTIEYGHDAVKNQTLSTPGRDVLDVVAPSGQGIFLQITETDPNGTGDYIRNIRVIMPGFESTYQTEIFNPAFIDSISKFRTIRFMDWMETNETMQTNWADRPLLDDARWTNREGVPAEMMVTLANHVSADPWFTMPHLADDNYIAQFAASVRDSLDPNLKVYVEYSNEVWNSAFPQANWVDQQAQAEWPGGSESNFTKRINWYGKRTAEMCDIWENVWGAESDRVVCVMGAQAANPWTAETALDCSLWAEAPCQAHNIDAVAIAPYFAGYIGKPDYEAVVTSWANEPDGGLDRLFTEIFAGGQLSGGPVGGALQQAIGWIENYGTLADARNFDLISYEGGQHLVGVYGVVNNNAITDLFHAANRDPRMGTAYEQYLTAWKNSGGRLFTHFTHNSQYTKFGAWGSMEFLDEPNTPKNTALTNFIENNPCWWPNCAAGSVSVVPVAPTGSISQSSPTYRWNEGGGGATQYQLVINDTNGEIFSTWYDTSTICDAGGCSVTPDLPLSPGDYQWKIRGMYLSGEGEWTLATDFTVVPVSTWYLAEGYTGSGFGTYILIQNPNETDAYVTLTYMLQVGGTVERSVVVPANSRYTVVAQDAGQVGVDQAFSTRLDSDQPIIVERAMYWPKGEGASGGHVTTGVTAPKNTWYLAEGFTGAGFGTFILIQNPNETEANVTLTYMLQDAGVVEKNVVISPNSRYTVEAHDAEQVGLDRAFSTQLDSDQPIVVERAMYFNNDGHAAVGVVTPVNSWYLAEGFTGAGFGTFILIQNPNETDANVTLTYMLQGGGIVEKDVVVSARSRYTVRVHDAGQLGLDQAFSTRLDSDQSIIVERAMYWPNGEGTSGGHNSLGVGEVANVWNLAEGFTGAGFGTFILIQNPNGTDAHVTLTYMLQGGGTVEKNVVISANSRYTVEAHDAGQVGLDQAFSTQLVSDQPIIVERAMYFNNGGHATNGVAQSD